MNHVDPCALFRTELPKVAKPARYLGGEARSIRKEEADYRIALCFPDLYEIGMANNAMRILYARLNALPGVACERVFAVAPDYEALLRSSGTPLYGLESGLALRDFDMIAFTVGYELAATNLLAVLELGGVPIRTRDRRPGDPVVLAGGPAITNPAPYAALLDAVWIGEAEEAFFGLIESARDARRSGGGREEVIALLNAEPAVWRPGKRAVRHAFEAFPDSRPLPPFPVPVVKPVQDHGVVEIMRGCPNGCRFCHAGVYYRPRRLRSVEAILADVEARVDEGHREISLSSLSSGDYPGITALIAELKRRWTDRGVSFQLPSLKVESFPLDVLEALSGGARKSGLTFAVETPLEPWQLALNKRVGIDKIKAILTEARERGYKGAKFYFMLGLPIPPAETSEEAAIVALIADMLEAVPGMRLNCTLATFVPKPHTPFQHCAQLSPERASERIFYIKDAFRKEPRVKVTYHAPYLSRLEGLVARGDERVGDLIAEAYRQGARFDAWDDMFNKEPWEAAMRELGFDAAAYLAPRDRSERLPWSEVSLRVSSQFLYKEYDRSRASLLTAPCSSDCEHPCGACSSDCELASDAETLAALAGLAPAPVASQETSVSTRHDDPCHPPATMVAKRAPTQGVRQRVLFRFAKRRAAAFFAHQEIMSMLRGALELAGLPLAYSEGFNPMPRLEISEPLPLGFESQDEYGVTVLSSTIDDVRLGSLITAAQSRLHADLSLLEARLLHCDEGRRFPSLSASHWGSRFRLCLKEPGLDPRSLVNAFDALLAETELLSGSACQILDDGDARLCLAFTGRKDLSLASLFERAYGAPLRDTGVLVVRERQYAKQGETKADYLDLYTSQHRDLSTP